MISARRETKYYLYKTLYLVCLLNNKGRRRIRVRHRLSYKVLAYSELTLYNFSLALIEMLCILPEEVGYKYIYICMYIYMGWGQTWNQHGLGSYLYLTTS